MKGIYVIAIGFLVSLAVSAASLDQNQPVQSVSNEDLYQDDIYTRCPYPERFPMNTTTNLPHEYDCTKFYKCDVGKGVLQDCPKMTKGDPYTRLHYNRRLQVCDWPWQAGCSKCPGKNPDGTYPPPSKINYEPDNCQYYQCINGEAHLRTCYPGTCFSRTCQACVTNRAGGNCNGGIIPTTSTTSTISPACRDGDTKMAICKCNCFEYRICENGNWHRKSCTGGLHYSPTKKICLPPDQAGCSQRCKNNVLKTTKNLAN